MKILNKIKPKLLTRLLPILIILGGSTFANASAPLMNLRFVVDSTNTNGNDTLSVRVQIEASTTGTYLGSSNFLLTFNTTDLNFASSPDSGRDYHFLGYDGINAGSIWYNPGVVVQSPTGTLSINVDYIGNGTSHRGQSVPATWTDLVRLDFHINNTSGNAGLTWAMNVTSGTPNTWTDVFEDNQTTRFSQGTATNNSLSPLPVTLINFSAYLQHHETVMNWATASEINNAYFTLERSADGVNFEPLTTVAGNGTSHIRHDYMAYDEQPLPGVSYYRLRQTDYNGKTETFNIVSVNNTDAGEFSISSAMPTNFHDYTVLNYKMPTDGNARMVVTSMSGQIVSDQVLASQRGNNQYRIESAGNWQPGMYVVTLYYNVQMAYTKVIKN